jgi:hypothetical protein
MPINFCPGCGHEVSRGAESCVVCGRNFSAPTRERGATGVLFILLLAAAVVFTAGTVLNYFRAAPDSSSAAASSAEAGGAAASASASSGGSSASASASVAADGSSASASSSVSTSSGFTGGSHVTFSTGSHVTVDGNVVTSSAEDGAVTVMLNGRQVPIDSVGIIMMDSIMRDVKVVDPAEKRIVFPPAERP